MSMRRPLRPPRDRGASTVEYVGIIIAVVVIVASVIGFASSSSLGQALVCKLESAVASITGQSAPSCAVEPPDNTIDPAGPDGSNDPGFWCKHFGWGCPGPVDDTQEDVSWFCTNFGWGCPTIPESDWPDVPEGMDTNSDLFKTLISTQRGRDTLQWMADNGVKIIIDENATGAYWDDTLRAMVMGKDYDKATTLIHEANHARYSIEGRTANTSEKIVSMSREDYVNAMIAEEADGKVQSILAAEEFNHVHQNGGTVNGLSEFDAAYRDAIKQGKTKQEALAAGTKTIVDMYNNGTFHTSNTSDTYPDYYGGAWDDAHR